MRDCSLVVFLDEKARLGSPERMPPYRAVLYQSLRARIGSVALVSFGGPEELRAEAAYPGIVVLCNRWRLPAEVYRQQLPWLHGKVLASASIIRAEQALAAPFAARAARHHGKRLVVRLGYAPSLHTVHHPSPKLEELRALERQAAAQADLLVVTTKHLERHLGSMDRSFLDRTVVVPNYVDCSLFRPAQQREEVPAGRLLAVGRLSTEKNFDNLVTAVRDLPSTELRIVGEGPLRSHLEQRIASEGIRNVALLGRLGQTGVLEELHRAGMFVQPTLVEGHPKTVLEAMATALPIVASNVPGVSDLLTHRVDGYLCGSSAAELRAGIEALLADETLRRSLAAQALRRARASYDLPVVAELELEALRKAMALPARAATPEPRALVQSAGTLARAAARRLVKAVRRR